MPSLKLKNLHKSYDDIHAVNDVCLDVSDKHFIVLAGPSGCGKTTLLQLIAGFLELDSGSIEIDGKSIDKLQPDQREIAMVFQEAALFPHLSVAENIAFGLIYGGMSKEEADESIHRIAALLGIDLLLHRQAKTLSGGQKQRVSIARALVRKPKLFLMDEPLGALDTRLRTQLRIEIADIFKNMDATFLYVTHDQIEAMTLADTLLIMKDGTLQQIGKPMELYHNPVNLFTANFLGKFELNQFIGYIRDNNVYWMMQVLPLHGIYEDQNIMIGIRVEHILLDDEFGCEGTLVLIENVGDDLYYHIRWEEQIVMMKGSFEHNFRVGDTLSFAFHWENAMFFDNETGNRLKLT